MKTFKNIRFTPCNDVQGVKGKITINGQVVSIISGLHTQGTKIDSPSVRDHVWFEVAIWESNDPSKWTTKKWISGAMGVEFPIKAFMNRRQINKLLKRIDSWSFSNRIL